MQAKCVVVVSKVVFTKYGLSERDGERGMGIERMERGGMLREMSSF